MRDEDMKHAVELADVALADPDRWAGTDVEIIARALLAATADNERMRALLATPMPAKYEGAAEAYETPYVFGGHISANWISHDLHVDDAVGLGAALLNTACAARAARDGGKR